jgi:hypothetical protein
MSNPAGLAGIHGAGLSYAQRTIDWLGYLESYRYHGANAYAESPIGVFGIQYNHFTEGEFTVVRYSSSPAGYVSGRASAYDHTIAVGFGRNIVKGLDAGITAKYHDFVFSWVGNVPKGVSIPSTTPAWLFDAVGCYTSFPMPVRYLHGLAVGTSIQNIGTKLKSEITNGGMRRKLNNAAVLAFRSIVLLAGSAEG